MRNKPKKKSINWNTQKIFLAMVFVSFFVIFCQLVYVSMFPTLYGINMREFAAARNTFSGTLHAKRGRILDSKGDPLAINISSFTVIAYLSEERTGASRIPHHVVDPESTAKALSPVLNMSEETLLNLLTRDAYQVELGPGGRDITELKRQEIQALNLPGISFMQGYKRYYPNGDFASYIIGYAKQNDLIDENGIRYNQIVGELGLELRYNDLLTGTDGHLWFQRDRHGFRLLASQEERIDPLDGADIHLTLNSSIQRFAESAIKDIARTYGPQWANIAVMEAKTGRILAASTIPSFNPNSRNVTIFRSPLVTETYEPGSVMKIYSYLCAIDSGKYNPNYQVQSGNMAIGNHVVRDWNRTGWGTINMDTGFIRSSNVAVAVLAQRFINRTELRECYEKFGFGRPTGVQLSREEAGVINFVYPIETVTAAFGQGITTTTMQQLQAMTIFANNGQMIRPRIVDKIVDPNTDTILYESTLEKTEQLVKPSSVRKMKDLMELVVNNPNDGWATGRNYYMTGYDLIGKTGTAQIPSPRGGYLTGDNDYISSFIGMYPKDDPELIIYVAVKQPTWGGGLSVQKSVREIVANTAKYLNLFARNSISTSTEVIQLESYINRNTNKVEQELKNRGVNVTVIGDGDRIIRQYPSANVSILSNDRVFLITNGQTRKLPNFVNWSRRDVEQLLKILNVNYTMSGNGFITEQSVEAGTEIERNLNIEFTLSNRFGIHEKKEEQGD